MLKMLGKKKINNYVKNILNENYDFDIDNSKELDNDILKIGQILKSKNELLLMYESIFEELYKTKSNDDLISDVIKIVNVSNGKEKLKYENIKLSSLISKSLEGVNTKDIEFKLNIKNTNLYIDVDWTKKVIIDIINILLKYTQKQITISSSVNSLYTEMRISNDGKIMNEEVSYILKKKIEYQGGIVEIETNKNIGTIFIIKFNKNV